jgi:hypothetical protein
MNKVLAITALVFALTSMAQDAAPQPRQGQGPGPRSGMFEVMDADKDGKVTKEELSAWFDKVDKNKDGVLTKEELRPAGQQGQGPRRNGPPSEKK